MRDFRDPMPMMAAFQQYFRRYGGLVAIDLCQWAV
jgi:hypothetical protein